MVLRQFRVAQLVEFTNVRVLAVSSWLYVYVKTFIHEPFAAVVAYCLRQKGQSIRELEGKNVLVFDWGGGTLDITIATIRSGRMIQLANELLQRTAYNSATWLRAITWGNEGALLGPLICQEPRQTELG